jgi:hypothetical protein
MQTIQKSGFVISNSIFIALELVFLIIGIIAKDRTLMIMGAVWLPVGIIGLLFIIHAPKKEK